MKLLRMTCLLSSLVLNACVAARPQSGAEAGTSLDDDRVAIVRAGSQQPAVVLQAGHQSDKKTWRTVMPMLAAKHIVVAFDRPGHGGNPAPTAPRDPCTIAAEQHELLQQLGVQPPYILVGHSLGGLYQYVYAKQYPDEVAGLVLLDPTHPHHWERMQHDVPQLAGVLKVMRVTLFSRVDKDEFDAQSTCLDTLKLDQPLTMPVRLLVSGRRPAAEKGAFEAMLNDLRQDWLGLLGIKQMQLIRDSGHFIQNDSPQDVVLAVEQVAAEVTAHSAR